MTQCPYPRNQKKALRGIVYQLLNFWKKHTLPELHLLGQSKPYLDQAEGITDSTLCCTQQRETEMCVTSPWTPTLPSRPHILPPWNYELALEHALRSGTWLAVGRACTHLRTLDHGRLNPIMTCYRTLKFIAKATPEADLLSGPCS